MYLTVSNKFINVSWYGKGLNESYWDRKTGLYSKKIIDQFHRYSRPQKTGNKTDIRWMEIASKDLKLKISSQSLLNASV